MFEFLTFLLILSVSPIQIIRIVVGVYIHSNNLSGVNQGFGNYLNINKFSLISNDY